LKITQEDLITLREGKAVELLLFDLPS